MRRFLRESNPPWHAGKQPRDNFLVLVSVYALTLMGQVSYWNAFGFDRSATQVYFSLPVPIRKALVGKNLAAAIFIFLEMAAVTAACLLLRMRIAPGKIVESFVVIGIAALYMLAVGNLALELSRGEGPVVTE